MARSRHQSLSAYVTTLMQGSLALLSPKELASLKDFERTEASERAEAGAYPPAPTQDDNGMPTKWNFRGKRKPRSGKPVYARN